VSDVENHVKVGHGFWAAVTGERATERELKRSHARDEASEAEDRVTRASVERSNSLGPPDQR
jgi:hypothetical protein